MKVDVAKFDAWYNRTISVALLMMDLYTLEIILYKNKNGLIKRVHLSIRKKI